MSELVRAKVVSGKFGYKRNGVRVTVRPTDADPFVTVSPSLIKDFAGVLARAPLETPELKTPVQPTEAEVYAAAKAAARAEEDANKAKADAEAELAAKAADAKAAADAEAAAEAERLAAANAGGSGTQQGGKKNK